jgi:hypothetical protein
MRQHYDQILAPWLTLNTRPDYYDYWLFYLIRLTHNKRTSGRRGSVSGTRAMAADAKTIESLGQLSRVEQRTFAILKGATAPRKKTKHPVEKQALALAEAIEAEWFPKATPRGRPKGRWQRKSAGAGAPERSFNDEKPPLTILEVVLIATPIIENFAQCRITRKRETFDALYWVVEAHSEVIQRHTPYRRLQISRKSVYQALRRSRSKSTDEKGVFKGQNESNS